MSTDIRNLKVEYNKVSFMLTIRALKEIKVTNRWNQW